MDKSGNPIANVRSNEIGNEENPVEISSGAMDYDTNTIIIRAGRFSTKHLHKNMPINKDSKRKDDVVNTAQHSKSQTHAK